jgi:hypothetical protein
MRGARAPEPVPPDAAKPAPVIRRVPTPSGTIMPPAAETGAPPAGARPVVYPVQATGPVSTGTGRVSVSRFQLVVAGLVIIGLLGTSFTLGRLSRPEIPLPDVEKKPTFPEIRTGPVAPNLVTPTPSRPAPSIGKVAGQPPVVAPEPVEPVRPAIPSKGPTAPAPAPATGPRYRVRILQLSVSQSHAVDLLQDFLSARGVETDLEARGGNYILFSREQFTDPKKSEEAAAQINKFLAAFEKEKRISTSKDAYSVKMTKE